MIKTNDLFSINKRCIFCNNIISYKYFKEDLTIPIGLYCIDNLEDNISIPYNILICKNCNTIQNKYLGNLNLVYKYGHNEGTGKLYKEMHNNFMKLILKNKNIKNILEVGCSIAILSDLLLKNNNNIFYTIVEPNLKCINNSRRIIFNDFIENIEESIIKKNDTLILSHVLEHFYEPKKILDKLLLNTNIKDFYLAWPDLDNYINNNIVNILTIEHIYYISTPYLENIIKSYGFSVEKKIYFKNHTIFFHFRKIGINKTKIILKDNDNSMLLKKYIDNIKYNLKQIDNIILNNSNKKIYLWPCSTHNITMLIYDKINIDKIEAFLDNSPNKINKTIIKFNKKCLSFSDIDKNNSLVILNGGPFNKELISFCKKFSFNYHVL